MSIEKNTVVLDVNVYNDLRDFKKNIENHKIISYVYSSNSFGQHSIEEHIYNKDEVIKSLVDRGNELIETIKELRSSLSEYQTNKEEINIDIYKEGINKIKKYNFFQLIKWWRKNRITK